MEAVTIDGLYMEWVMEGIGVSLPVILFYQSIEFTMSADIQLLGRSFCPGWCPAHGEKKLVVDMMAGMDKKWACMHSTEVVECNLPLEGPIVVNLAENGFDSAFGSPPSQAMDLSSPLQSPRANDGSLGGRNGESPPSAQIPLSLASQTLVETDPMLEEEDPETMLFRIAFNSFIHTAPGPLELEAMSE